MVVEPVPSPCTSVCRMDPRTGWCEGCTRTLDEIAAWSTMSDDDKRRVWDALDARRLDASGFDAPGSDAPKESAA